MTRKGKKPGRRRAVESTHTSSPCPVRPASRSNLTILTKLGQPGIISLPRRSRYQVPPLLPAQRSAPENCRNEPELHRCSTTYPKCCLLGLWCRYVYRRSILQLKVCTFPVDAISVQSVVASSFRQATTDGFNCLLTTGSSLKQQSSHSCKCSAAFPPLLWNLESDSHIIAHQVIETLCSPQCTHCFSELHYTTSAVGMPHLLINTGSFKKFINLACPH